MTPRYIHRPTHDFEYRDKKAEDRAQNATLLDLLLEQDTHEGYKIEWSDDRRPRLVILYSIKNPVCTVEEEEH